jgi:sugar/nucleoside kinase (ribokinase family)
MNSKSIDCTVVGDAMIDIVVLGMSKMNPRGTSYCKTISVQPGGGGNIIEGLSKFGVTTAFIGKVGSDALGSVYNMDLDRLTPENHLIFDETIATGTCISMVDEEGERSMIVFRGANDTLTPQEIDNKRDIIANSKYLYVCGYSLIERPQADAIKKAVLIAKNEGVKVIFDPGSYNIVRDKEAIVRNLLASSDIVLPNQDEGRELAKGTSLNAIIEFLGKVAPKVFLKLGGQGCVIIEENSHQKISVGMVDSIDTTGAGDAFAAATIYGLTQNFSLEKTGTIANWFASRNVQLAGPRSFPDKHEIREMLESID